MANVTIDGVEYAPVKTSSDVRIVILQRGSVKRLRREKSRNVSAWDGGKEAALLHAEQRIARLEAENAELVSDLKTVVDVLSGEIILLSPVEGLKIRDSELTIGERAIRMAGRSSSSQGAAPGTVTMQAAQQAALQLQQSQQTQQTAPPSTESNAQKSSES